jgi:hypothetical protein
MIMRKELLEIVSPVLSQDTSPDAVVDAILKALELEEEWAVAEYDEKGNIVQINHNDYDLFPVMRQLVLAEKGVERMRDRGIEIGGTVGLASRVFTRWRKANG